ncbi:alpha/beta fold hydrolase [Formosa algae]|uniref:Pimeloyl-ACP methyl ester carboxylesterase n=1 Tax=Formosa algae TaxID=225843 RepID=A0A9X0YNL9_9FLAO|nr:alpha/beta hydrolase [Formosa algae]MBP1840291.1 pimeloyl-ACP methyl ester carboxylesterase [Formosa algae]MDQ0334155.1 pimeloyl-ACP methyl ester carboxylesterase [Formosa algae]OEI79480.1 alpha/beta hydrolase [Formosa algae]PNW29499.1 alpha/beta hydrolase [Formosa algae]
MILQHKGSPIYFSDQGKGTAIILLHGFLENSSMWKRIAPELAKKHRVICIDLLGHGDTACIGYIHTMDMMADAVQTVLNHLKIRRYYIVGHSMGGYVSLVLAERLPDNIKGLVLMNSTAKTDSPERLDLRNRAIEVVKRNYKSMVKMSIANLFKPENTKTFAKDIDWLKSEALRTPLQGYIAAQEGMKVRQDLEVLFHFSPYKKMIIYGNNDPVLDPETIIKQTLNTDVELVALPGGHMSYIENESETLQNLTNFIE